MSIFDIVIWNVICKHVDSVGTLNKIAEAWPQCHAMVDRNKAKLEQKWSTWLKNAPEPPEFTVHRNDLDKCFRTLVLNHKKQITIRSLSVSEHLRVNQRAIQLGLTGTEFDHYGGYSAGRRDVIVSKPKDWRMRWNKAHRIPMSALRRQTPRVDHPSIEDWIGECIGCEGEVNADGANYNFTHGGPWCDSCISHDKALKRRNLRWRTKADQWVYHEDRRDEYDLW